MRVNLEKLPPYPADFEADLAEIKQNEATRRHELRERAINYCKRTLGGIAVGLAMTASVVEHDIANGKEAVADSHSSLHFVYESDDPAYDNVATIVATGLGTRNPTETAETLRSHKQIGNVYALEYSNKDINIDELTDTVVNMAHDKDIHSLVFDGYSAGGPIELAIAANIHKNVPDIQVSAIIMGSSPIGDQGITQESQRAGDTLSMIVNMYPDIIYSEKLRGLVELTSRHERYMNLANLDFDRDEFIKQAEEVYRTKIADNEAASAVLIMSQYNFIQKYGVERSLETLSHSYDDKPTPYVYYTRARDARADTVVDVERSQKNLNELAHKYNIETKVFYIDNIGHANPGERPTEYNETFALKIQPEIKRDMNVANQDSRTLAAGVTEPPVRTTHTASVPGE